MFENNKNKKYKQKRARQDEAHSLRYRIGMLPERSPKYTIPHNDKKVNTLLKENRKSYIYEYGYDWQNSMSNNAVDVYDIYESVVEINTLNDNFYKWFDGSKCVNEKGEPLVVYHGTDYKIKSFNRAKIGKKELNIMSLLGFHFTPDYNMAHTLFTKTGNVIECYLSIKNPYIAKESEIVKDCLRLAKKNGKISEKVKLNKLLDMEYWDNDGGLANQLYLDAHKAENGGTPLINYQEIAKDYLKYLKSQGYDGIKYLNEIEWAQDNRYDWIVFEPNQIKSVNAKEFSNSSNIYEELNKEIEEYL